MNTPPTAFNASHLDAVGGHHEAKAVLCILTFSCKLNYVTAVTLVPAALSLPCSPTRFSSKNSRPIQKMQHEKLK